MAATNIDEKLKKVREGDNASIDQIREILFGQDIHVITEQIAQLKQALDQLNVRLADLRDRFEINEKEKGKSLKSLRDEDKSIQKALDDINEKIEELLANKVDKQQLGQALKVLADDLDHV